MRLDLIVIAVVLVMIGSSVATAVETREVEQIVYVDPYYPDDYTSTINWSDPANANLSNYNQTVLPFMNESGVDGTFTGTFMPPILAQVSEDTTATASWVSCIARFKSNWVMSGSSYSWWRVPVQNISGWMGATLNLTIWHIDNPAFLNITDIRGDPNEMSRPIEVYSNGYDFTSGLNKTWRNQTVTAWDYEWNYTWVRVVAPIHSDESYYVRFGFWHNDLHGGHQIMFAQTDTGDDNIYKSWVYVTDIQQFECDLDISVIHEYGMGYSVSGFEVDPNSDVTAIVFYSNLNATPSYDDYITFMMPFMFDVGLLNNVAVQIKTINGTWSHSWYVATDAPVDFTINSWPWHEYWTETLFEIILVFHNRTNWLYVWDQFSDFYVYEIDNFVYRENRFHCVNHTWAPSNYNFYFTPYHAFQVSDGEWVNTHIDPIYYFDGRYYSHFQFERVEHSDPWYIQILNGLVWVPYYIYQYADKVIFQDMLPNLDKEMYLYLFSAAAHAVYVWFHTSPVGKVILAVGAFIVEAIKFIVKWAPYVLAAIMKGIILFIFVPIFIFIVLLYNGLKRFFVLLVEQGPEVASQYADDFVRKSTKLISNPRAAISEGISDAGGTVKKYV